MWEKPQKRFLQQLINIRQILLVITILVFLLLLSKFNLPFKYNIISKAKYYADYEWSLKKIDINDLTKVVQTFKEVKNFKDLFKREIISNSDITLFAQPVINGKITSGFGLRLHPIEKVLKPHNGIDINQTEGTPVHTVLDGEVIFVGSDAELGNYVKIAHEGNMITLYAHLKDVYVKTKDKVKKGQIIGSVGKTGMAEEPHLHFEVWKDNEPQDPLKWLNY
ncbi:MAG: M23 family metallopeptidase [Thermovenabulum sp.]|uniref:M23 family metallopeptidase n=1 Tax=Thermovenabulum sp. TaxID=3100335 RepID=UPI003C7E45D9